MAGENSDKKYINCYAGDVCMFSVEVPDKRGVTPEKLADHIYLNNEKVDFTKVENEPKGAKVKY